MATIVGQVLLSQFRVDSFVNSGGMGAVYRVWDIKRDVPLAMKVLHGDLANDPVILRRFQREANALKKLAHPNIVPFYGLYQTLDLAFLLERFIDGPSLAEILRQRKGRPLTLEEVLVYLKAMCAALGYAHANGVVHCDVKPGNVMIDRGGAIFLTDFGIARHAESTLTTMGVAGTPAYMAPEQIRGKKVSPATDVYALGVVLFEMLTGQRPFRGDEAGTEKGGLTAQERIRYGQLNLLPPDPRSINPSLSTELSAIILKALSKAPEDRYASTQALYTAICNQVGIAPASIADHTIVPAMQAQADYTVGKVVIPGSEPAAFEPHPVVSQPVRPKLSIGAITGIALMSVIILVAVGIAVLPLLKPKPTAASTANGTTSVPNNPSSQTTNNQPAIPGLSTDTPAASPTSEPSPTNTVPPSPTPDPALARTKDGMRMVFVPAGEFTMGTNEPGFGNAQPQHNVTLSDYWIDETDVTNAMFQKFIGETGWRTEAEKKTFTEIYTQSKKLVTVNNLTWQHPRDPKTDVEGLDHPVVQVSWNDADEYCRWAGKDMKDIEVNLPTEAQWEKAARGTDGRNYPWVGSGFGPDTLNYGDENLRNWIIAWNRQGHNVAPWGSPGDDGYLFTSPVGHYPNGASPYGALDMVGNVMQWVSDFYKDGFEGQKNAVDPQGPSGSVIHVLKGSFWKDTEQGSFTFIRNGKSANYTTDYIGFRCAAAIVKP